MTHNRSLDGLRGVAVLFVILFHFGYFTAGWIGVQMFFVLSGYLITSILVSDKHHPAGFFFKRFFWRRSLRIFPLYFAYLVLLAAVYALSGAPVEFAERWAYLFSYTYNYSLLLVPLQQSPAFTHFWSLAVEEQFYLLWPVLVYYVSAQSLKAIVLAALALAPLFRLLSVLAVPWIAPGHAEPGLFAYSPLPAQCDALATGAALALFDVRGLRRPLATLAAATAVILAAGYLNWRGSTGLGQFPDAGAWNSFAGVWNQISGLGIPPFSIRGYQHVWSYTLVNVWSALVIVNLVRGGALARLFSSPVLVYSGTISYGLYVLHYPLLGLIRQAVFYRPVSPEGLAVFGVYLVLCFAGATLSFRYFESRFLAYKDQLFRLPPAGRRAIATRSALSTPPGRSPLE